MIHVPVMLKEVLELLKPCPSKTFLDCTFGRGGHTKALLEFGAKVVSLDRDIAAYAFGKQFEFSRFKMMYGKFSQIGKIMHDRSFDGILFDFGLSSDQIQDPNRGISFKNDGPLDMRMGLNSISAADFLNSATEKDIADVIYNYGEERKSRQIAKAIVLHRKKCKLKTTKTLADIIHKILGNNSKIDTATRTFQSIRIHVNEELDEIKQGLEGAQSLLKFGGKVITIAFHSLEDRIVKNHCKETYGYNPKPIIPSLEEIRANRRSRSAKLRLFPQAL